MNPEVQTIRAFSPCRRVSPDWWIRTPFSFDSRMNIWRRDGRRQSSNKEIHGNNNFIYKISYSLGLHSAIGGRHSRLFRHVEVPFRLSGKSTNSKPSLQTVWFQKWLNMHKLILLITINPERVGINCFCSLFTGNSHPSTILISRRALAHVICPSISGCRCEVHFGFMTGFQTPFVHVAFGGPNRSDVNRPYSKIRQVIEDQSTDFPYCRQM